MSSGLLTRPVNEALPLAQRLARTLDESLQEPEVFGALQRAYTAACQELARFGAVARPLGPDDRLRFRFEAGCFAAWFLMGQEIPRVLGRPSAGDAPPEAVRWIKAFNTAFSNTLEECLRDAEQLREIRVSGIERVEVEFGPPLYLGRRVMDYRGRTAQSLVETFGLRIAEMLDPEHNIMLALIGASLAPEILDIARGSVQRVLDSSDC